MTQNTAENFIKMTDVLAYLQAQGRKVSQSQLYKDMNAGYLKRQKDASFKKRDVDSYAQSLKALALPEKEANEMSGLARQESEERLAKMREQRLSIAFDRGVKQGKYIKREDVTLELASRAAMLSVGLRSAYRLHAPDLVSLVGGDTNKTHIMLELFEKNLDAALHEYSRPIDFKVEYVPDNDNTSSHSTLSSTDTEAD